MQKHFSEATMGKKTTNRSIKQDNCSDPDRFWKSLMTIDITKDVRDHLVKEKLMSLEKANSLVRSVITDEAKVTTVVFDGTLNKDAEKIFHVVLKEMPGTSLTLVFKFEGML